MSVIIQGRTYGRLISLIIYSESSQKHFRQFPVAKCKQKVKTKASEITYDNQVTFHFEYAVLASRWVQGKGPFINYSMVKTKKRRLRKNFLCEMISINYYPTNTISTKHKDVDLKKTINRLTCRRISKGIILSRCKISLNLRRYITRVKTNAKKIKINKKSIYNISYRRRKKYKYATLSHPIYTVLFNPGI